MKRLLALVLLALMLSALCLTVSADEVIDQARYTDIVAYIDGYPIRSYNVRDNTYIMVEDLSRYGFTVIWDDATRRLVIDPERTVTPDRYTTTYTPEAIDPALLGAKCADIYATGVTTWYGDTELPGCNIGGYTLIWLDDLARASDSALAWVPEEKALKMTTPEIFDPMTVTEGSWGTLDGVLYTPCVGAYQPRREFGTENTYPLGASVVVTDRLAAITLALTDRIVTADTETGYYIEMTTPNGRTHVFVGYAAAGDTSIYLLDAEGNLTTALCDLLRRNASLTVSMVAVTSGGYLNDAYAFPLYRENFVYLYQTVFG